jgi:hypothetical protein
MPTERCWNCKLIKRGVELCPSDDRLCPECYTANERQLKEQRSATTGDNAAAASAVSILSDGPPNSDDESAHKPSAGDGGKSRSGRGNDKKSGRRPAVKQSTAEAATPDTAPKQSAILQERATTACQTDGSCNTEAELTELRQLVDVQQGEINALRQQLDFVLSFLEIKGTEIGHSTTVNQSESSEQSHPCAAEDATGANDTPSWSEVVVSRRRRPPRQPFSERSTHLTDNGGAPLVQTQRLVPQQTLQESLITAVYLDQSNQKRRSSSMIISGLQPDSSKSDRLLFSQLVLNEFGLQPEIVYVKRLGQPSPGKTRPLLVALKSIDQAQHIINSARQLRQSENPIVRDGVYINPNLTKAEAAAAYQLRIQRRQAAQRRARQSAASPSQHDQHQTPAATAAAPDISNEPGADHHPAVAEAASALNAAAQNFVPASNLHSSA